VVLQIGILPAAATPDPPAWAHAWYLSSTVPNHYYNLGCTLANNVDSGVRPVDSLTILQFGGAVKFSSTSWGATLYGGPDSTTPTIKNLAQQFGQGFYDCIHNRFATAKVTIGTNSSTIQGWSQSDLDAHGRAWGQMVNGANTWAASQGISSVVSFAGSNDMEVEWTSPWTARTWVNGFRAAINNWNLFNVGNATDCTAGSYACWPGWDKSDLWYISWGSGFSNAAPQIYATSGHNATQWYAVSRWGVDNHSAAGPVNFVSSVSQAARCQGTSPPPGCSNADITPDQSWTFLWNALHPGPTSDDIRWSENFNLD
jgi:hypothetical protein